MKNFQILFNSWYVTITWLQNFLSLFFKKNIYLFIWERGRERAQVGEGAEGEGEADFPLSREPDAGLDPKTLRSWPEVKADA